MASKIVAINDDIVAKYGGCINVWEGQALVYLERHVPEVPAPRLYAMYYDSKQLFLIMQGVPGAPLHSIWPSLAHSEKDDIIAKLPLIFDAMRKAECPWPDFFGGLDGGGVHHYLFYSQHGDEKFLGPFSGEPALAAGLVGNYRALVERNYLPDYKAHFYEKYLARVLQGHWHTLTHGDFQQKNIMVAENTSRPNDQGGRSFDIVLVDWENSGWFPDFWEFFCASSPNSSGKKTGPGGSRRLSKTYVAIAGCHPLRDEDEDYARKLVENGVQVTVRQYTGVPHPFMRMLVVKKAQMYMDDIYDHLRMAHGA